MGTIGQHQQAFTQRAQDLLPIAPGKIGPADRPGKERVAGQQQVVIGEEEADASRSMSWSVQHLGGQGGEPDGQAILGTGVRRRHLGCGDTKPAGLHFHHAQQLQILLVHKHRRPGRFS